MDAGYRRVERIERTIRYHIEAPVTAKDFQIVLSMVHDEIIAIHGQDYLSFDDAYKIEGADDEVIISFRVRTDYKSGEAPKGSC